MGLTPYIHGMVLNTGYGFSVMVQIFPNMKYYEETQMELALFPVPPRAKLAIGVAVVSFLVGLGIAGTTVIGTSV